MRLFPTRKQASEVLGDLLENHILSEQERQDTIQIRMCLEQEEKGAALWGTDMEKARPLFFPPAENLPEKEKEKNDRVYRRALRNFKKGMKKNG